MTIRRLHSNQPLQRNGGDSGGLVSSDEETATRGLGAYRYPHIATNRTRPKATIDTPTGMCSAISLSEPIHVSAASNNPITPVATMGHSGPRETLKKKIAVTKASDATAV